MKSITTFTLGIVIGAVLFYFATNYSDETQVYLTALSLLGILIAYIQFRQDKSHKDITSVIDQLGFFRVEVLKIREKVIEEIIKVFDKLDYESLKIENYIETFTYRWVYINFPEKIKKQSKICTDERIENLEIELLNSMEQFSWSVILNNTLTNQGLYAVHDAFCDIVEEFAHLILFKRGIKPRQYEGIKRLYEEWALRKRETFEETLNRITKE